jgi:hypothetical protein
MDPDPDPGGSKTCGSGSKSGSATLLLLLIYLLALKGGPTFLGFFCITRNKIKKLETLFTVRNDRTVIRIAVG